MTHPTRSLTTRGGTLRFPAYFPVTTFGARYPLDDLVRPYLPRLAPGVMVSYYYAYQMQPDQRPRLPLLVDSGGFASLFGTATVEEVGGLGRIRAQGRTGGPEVISPQAVLALQERIADVAFTLDFPIPPQMSGVEAERRLALTIQNALWARATLRRRDLPLYACVQGWDAASARRCARAYQGKGFSGLAIGGLIPRADDFPLVLDIVRAVREESEGLPLHVFGLGRPAEVRMLFEAGVDSVDSSAFVKLAAAGRLWGDPSYHNPTASPTERLHLALCNLALATGQTLPLALTRLVYQTAWAGQG